jgi:murein L,D-transpeptidase YcbB/YkuD
VAGRPKDETPMLQSQIESIVFNPAWHVPDSIARKEIWPKVHRNPGYLARENMMVVKTDDGGARLVQRPGPKNSLGQIKFDFPNPYGVYLHDTPVRATFSRSSRMASHGCVRLEHPQELAKLLLSGDPQWDDAHIDETIAGEDTVRARLPHSVPVFIFYWTAFADPGGPASFRSDPYGWDDLLISRLAGTETAA